MTLIDCLDTSKNEDGLCSLNPETNTAVLAIPDKQEGDVRVRRYCQNVQSGQGIDVIAKAVHKTPVMTLALTRNGEYLATAGQSGTKVKLWRTKVDRKEGEEQNQQTFITEALYTVRRGLDRAVIKDLVFSASSQLLAASSDHATLHVWKLPMKDQEYNEALKEQIDCELGNQGFMLKIYSKLSKFPVSYARWQIDHGQEKKYLAFSEDEKSIILVTKQGDYYLLPILPGEQEVPKNAYKKILQTVGK